MNSSTNTRNGSTSSSTAEARRMRKRELDRHAQRCARQRTKDRIAFLEARLEESYRAEPGQRRVAALLDELAAVKQQRDELVAIVSSIRRTLVGVSTTQHTSPPATTPLTALTPPAPAPVDDVEPIVPLPETPCHCIDDTPSASRTSRNIWRSVNCTLTKRQQHTPSSKISDILLDEDVPVRAVVQGWHAVEQAGLLSAAWKKLRAVDELCFATCDQVVRLAVLATMYIFLRWDTDPTPQNLQAMPKWYLQRPSQKMAHSGAIDYFVWPGVRERFVFSQHRYCSNLFWNTFSANLRILWAHGFDSCYQLDLMTGRYCIAPAFKNQIRDLRCWTMLRGFFDHFPDLACDIPTCDDVPQSLPLTLFQTNILEGNTSDDHDDWQDARQEAGQEARLDTLPYGMTPAMLVGHLTSPDTVDDLDFWQLADLVGGDVQGLAQV
ncbi:hypothetical protein SEUCBS139899_007630 [Sporothrix eucalyptigena]